MAILTRFDTPGRLLELADGDREAWSDTVAGLVADVVGPFPQFYDPTVTDTPDDIAPSHIIWSAFPTRLLREEGAGEARWARADSVRDEQDEYCEWSIERDADGKIGRITFTTEVREYWKHVAVHERDRLLEFYHEQVGPQVSLSDLLDEDGQYVPRNRWNISTEGRLIHLVQGNNNLEAAIQLAAQATILRHDSDGKPVTDRQQLVRCGGLGHAFRNSDPQIAEIVNDAAALGAEITLLDPFGLYLDGLQSAGMQTPDGADAAAFWQIERGTREHALRASFAVPEDRGYSVGDIMINGRAIDFGAQVADKVRIRLSALAKPATHEPVRRPCVG
jgi:hypothetical protein